MTTTAFLLLGLLMVLACAVFVAAEFAFVTVDRNAVDRAAAAGDRGARGIQSGLRSLSTQLSGAQVGITLTNLSIGFLAEPALSDLIGGLLRSLGASGDGVRGISLTLSLVAATGFTMVFGELIPKNVAIAQPFATSRVTQLPMRAFTTATALPIRVLNGTANAVVRRLGVEPQEELRSARSADELASLVQRSASEGTLDAETAGLVQKSVAFGDRTAGEIMTPRVRMSSVHAKDSAQHVIDLARSTGHSRFPVVKVETDEAVGAIHVKHAVAVPREERSRTKVRDLMVDVAVIPESLRLNPLLALLRSEGYQVAVVLDEYGGTAGIVTLEDVVEEIVGEIVDEHDRHDSSVRRRADGTWSVSGLLRPDEVADATGIVLPEDESYDTVAGLLLRLLGRIPEVGDSAEVELPQTMDDDGEPGPVRIATLIVDRMAGLRIDRIRIAVREIPRDEHDPDGAAGRRETAP